MKSNRPAKQRQKMGFNLIPVCFSLLVPWILFIVVYAATSFSLHYTAPAVCWFIVAIGAVAVLAGIAVTAISATRGKDPTWYGFFVCSHAHCIGPWCLLGHRQFRRQPP